jgi:hypothetical protein
MQDRLIFESFKKPGKQVFQSFEIAESVSAFKLTINPCNSMQAHDHPAMPYTDRFPS